ncbi:MAG: hypothetical protein ACI9G1_006021 [Pirellulaceae bacterium]
MSNDDLTEDKLSSIQRSNLMNSKPHQISRRSMISGLGAGIGALGLASVFNDLQAGGKPHFAPRAKRVIQLFMPGGPSAVDTFDHKPAIEKYSGQRPEAVQFRTLRNTQGGLLKSPFEFTQHGESGKWVSSIFPVTAKHVDDICFIDSMHTDLPEHASGILMMNIGHNQAVRPCLGSWLQYGLGTESQDLPGYVVLSPGGGARGGQSVWGNSFLPGKHAGCMINLNGLTPQKAMRDLQGPGLSIAAQTEQTDLIGELNRLHLKRRERDQQLEANIAAMELAFRMQTAVPEAFDINAETEATRKLYGDKPFSKGCLLARRLAERGVRMVTINGGNDIAWDSHGRILDHQNLARDVDQGIAGLLQDLKQRGMLDDTLVIWGGEFGRAPTAEGAAGRDHNHYGFTVWMAGGGVKRGFTYGAKDEFGCRAIENRVHVHDLHATILHLMGLDHEKLTYRYSGRDFRLTDVEGNVVKEIIA